MAKRKIEESSNSIEGYVSNVSPIKLSRDEKTRYFTAELQVDKATTHRVVCFSPEKYDRFKAAQQSNHAFLLSNAAIQPGKENTLDIKVTRGTVMTVGRQLKFSKSYKEYLPSVPKEPPIVNLNDIKDDYMMCSINVKYLGVLVKDKEVNTKYGMRKITRGLIADKTGTIELTLWSPDIASKLKAGSFYKITNLQSKLFDGKIHLNTTATSTVLPISEFDNVVEDLSHMKQNILNNIKVVSAHIIVTCRCSVCTKPITIPEETSSKLVRCNNCHHKQLLDSLKKSIQANTTIKDEESLKKVLLTEEILTAFLSKENKTQLLHNADALEDYLLLHSPLKIVLPSSGDVAISIEPADVLPCSGDVAISIEPADVLPCSGDVAISIEPAE